MPMMAFPLTIFALILACNQEVKKEEPIVEEITIYDSTLTKENLLKFIVEQDVQNPIIVMKQACLETGHFTSRGCHERNNLFGFRTSKGYLKFDTWQQCVLYYKDMQCRRYNGEDYYKWLKLIGFAEDTNYIAKLKQIRL